MNTGRSSCVLLVFSGCIALGGPAAFSQEYPNRPIRMIVPFPPTAGSDVVARLVGLTLSERLGQNVVVDNRSGASGTIGAEIAANSPPDGYTILTISTSHAVNVSLYKKLQYDMVRDFAPITLVASAPNILSVNLSLAVASVEELVALARAKPGRFHFASSGVGSSSHLAGELFKSLAGVDIVHVPYRGSGPALVGLLGGQVQLAFFSIPSTLPHVKTGKLRALGVGSSKRSRLMPELPTLAEAGVPKYDAETWYGVLVPTRTPRAIVNRLNREIRQGLETADIRERLVAQGAEPLSSSPEEFAAYIKSEIVKYAAIVKKMGVQIE